MGGGGGVINGGGQPALAYGCPEADGLGVSVPGGRLCLGIIPEGAGFTLLAREDKHSLHMLRDHDKGIASLNEKDEGKKK